MVSNASVDFPEPERPVMVTSLFFGISKLMFFKLCSRAPRIINLSFILPTLFEFLPIFLYALLRSQSQAPLQISSLQLQLQWHVLSSRALTCALALQILLSALVLLLLL